MTIKVFTAPRRTPQFEIWRLGSPLAYTASQRCRYLAPSFSPFRRFQSLSPPLSLSRRLSATSFFLFRIPFLVSLCTYMFGGVSHGEEDRIPRIPRGFPYYLQPPSCPRNNLVRIRERASVSPNWWKPYENVVTCPGL